MVNAISGKMAKQQDTKYTDASLNFGIRLKLGYPTGLNFTRVSDCVTTKDKLPVALSNVSNADHPIMKRAMKRALTHICSKLLPSLQCPNNVCIRVIAKTGSVCNVSFVKCTIGLDKDFFLSTNVLSGSTLMPSRVKRAGSWKKFCAKKKTFTQPCEISIISNN